MTRLRFALLATVLAAVPAPALAQTAPRGAVPACEDARYQELMRLPAAHLTDQVYAEFRGLDRACADGMAQFYQTTAAARMLYVPAAPTAPTAPAVSGREPAEALIWSLMIPGGGQVYNRQVGKGGFFFLLNVAGWAGLVMLAEEADPAPALVGLSVGAVFGSYWGSLLDAVRSAR